MKWGYEKGMHAITKHPDVQAATETTHPTGQFNSFLTVLESFHPRIGKEHLSSIAVR